MPDGTHTIFRKLKNCVEISLKNLKVAGINCRERAKNDLLRKKLSRKSRDLSPRQFLPATVSSFKVVWSFYISLARNIALVVGAPDRLLNYVVR